MTREEAIELLDNLIGMVEDNHGSDYDSALKMAIADTEKQIPKKPNQSGFTDGKGVFHIMNGINGVPYDLCPNCETNLCTDGYFGRSKKGFNYCEKCGQALDWSKEND